MPETIQILNAQAIDRALTRIAHEIIERNVTPENLILLGIQRKGVFIANRLGAIINHVLGKTVAIGAVDISMHRDDLDQKVAPTIHPTQIPGDINGKVVVLIDDVLFNGRTIRAALDAVMDYGRPGKIELAVLIDRGHRQLPIRADYVGKNVPTQITDHIEMLVQDNGDISEVCLISAK